MNSPKLDNPKNQHGEKSVTIISSPCKRKLQQDQESQLKLTKIKLTRNKKSKIETKTTNKKKEQKQFFFKKIN